MGPLQALEIAGASKPSQSEPNPSRRPFTAVTRVRIPPGTPTFSVRYGACLRQLRGVRDEFVTNGAQFAPLSPKS
jgi:hypothetical protein